MNCIKNERIKNERIKKIMYKKWTYKNEIIKNERIKNECIKNELIKKRTDPCVTNEPPNLIKMLKFIFYLSIPPGILIKSPLQLHALHTSKACCSNTTNVIQTLEHERLRNRISIIFFLKKKNLFLFLKPYNDNIKMRFMWYR